MIKPLAKPLILRISHGCLVQWASHQRPATFCRVTCEPFGTSNQMEEYLCIPGSIYDITCNVSLSMKYTKDVLLNPSMYVIDL